MQNILILLVESGLVYLGFQVSHFCTRLADTRRARTRFSKFSLCQITYLTLNAYGNHLSYPFFAQYGVEAIFYSLAVSDRQTSDPLIYIRNCRLCIPLW